MDNVAAVNNPMQKTIMGYVPTRSPIYSLHPVTRLVLFLITSVIPLFIENPEANIAIILIMLLMYKMAKVNFSRLKMFVPLFVTVFVILQLTYFFFPIEKDLSMIVFSIGAFASYYNSMQWALCTYFRIFALVLASIFYFSTNRERDILVALRSVGLPFAVSYFMGLTLRSVGIFLEDYEIIKEAEIARGMDTRNLSLKGKVKHFAMNLVPLFTISIRRSGDISIGLYAKGMHISSKVNGVKRVDYIRSKYSYAAKDYVLMATLSLLLLTIALIRITTPLFALDHSVTYTSLYHLLLNR